MPQATITAIRHPTYAWRVGALGEADFRSVLEFLEVAGEVDGVDPFPQPVLAALRRLIPADVVSYGDFDLEGPGWRVARVPWEGVPRGAMTPDIRQAHVQFTHQIPHPPWAPFAGRAVRWSDLLSRPKLLRLDAYVEVGKPLGAKFQLELWLRTPDGVAGGFAFDQWERDFSERDVRVLDTLRPHLIQQWRNAWRRTPVGAGLLTPREREVLTWVARGKTNREIAAALYLAPGTIRKHLDNVYAKLDVGSRAAAVARAFLTL